MRTFWTLLALAAMLSVGVFKAQVIWRQELWRDPKVRSHLLFWVNGAVGMGLLLGPVAVAVDGWTGMHNLAWLLAYLALLLPGYLVGMQVSGSFPAKGPLIRWLLKWGFLATTAILILLYAVWLRPSPEWPQRTARTLAEVFFIGLFFTVISTLPVLTLALIRSSFQRKPTLAFRLRMSVSAVAMVTALVCFGSKLVGAVAAFAVPASPLSGQLDQLAWVAMGVTALAWLVSMLPNRVFLAAVGPVFYVDKLTTLHALRRLYGRLVELSSPVVAYDPSWGEMALRPDFHLYRLAIGILDGRKMIQGQAAAIRRQGGLGGSGSRSLAVNWSMRQWREAEVLETLLAPLAANDLDSLAEELVVISRQAREYLD